MPKKKGRGAPKGKKPKGPPPYEPHRPKRGLLGALLAERDGEALSASSGSPRRHGYTMADEARNTAHNRRAMMGLDAKLRYQPVKFTSAGVMDPLKDFEVEREVEDNPLKSRPTVSPKSQAPPILEPVSADDTDSKIFTIDLAGDKSLHPNKDESWQSVAPADPDSGSDASDEVILFKGRFSNRQPGAHQKTPDGRENPEGDLQLRELSYELEAVEKSVAGAAPVRDAGTTGKSALKTPMVQTDFISLSSKVTKNGRPPRRRRKAQSDEDEAAVIADYIANTHGEEVDDSEGHSLAFNHLLRDLGGTDSEAIPERPSSDGDLSSRSSSGGEDDGDDEDDAARDEIDDEHLARLLTKQEELGLGGDEILLFDGAGQGDKSDDDWQIAPRGTTRRRKKKGDSKQAKITKKKGQFPSATQMADAFDEFDVMDWHHPSLNNFNVNRKGPKTFNVSDSELEEAMQLAWRKDRLKKAEKKKAREELRSQGLLGKNANPDDLRLKYRGGMSIDDLEDEFEIFILGDQEQLILPPLDKNARMVIHQVANRLKVKSQSAGKGTNRHPVLYRTKSTLPFNQQLFDQAFGHVRRSWFPRVDVDERTAGEAKVLRRAERTGQKPRGNRSLTYREGDVVGEHAKEIGEENKGRAMLEKMGWSKGMALGTEENQGIMVPIKQIVKKTKAGLGET